MSTTTTRTPTTTDVETFLGQVAADAATVFHAATVVLGDKLGLYTALADGGPATPGELADRTGCDERYLQDWLCAQVASGYCGHDPATGRFALSPAQATVLADETSPAFAAGLMALAAAVMKDEGRLGRDAFRTGAGIAWHDHHPDLFSGTERLFKPGYVANLVPSWIPALDGVEAKLTAGATVAGIGCGHGASTIVMAEAYPRSTFVGSDYHDGSIETARVRVAAAGVADRVRFETAAAARIPEQADREQNGTPALSQLAFLYRDMAEMERRNGRAGRLGATGVRFPGYGGNRTPETRRAAVEAFSWGRPRPRRRSWERARSWSRRRRA
jgi:hypothetical protein